MPDISMGKLLFILVIALIVIGPKRLPEVARWLGKMVYQLRKMSDEFRKTLRTEFESTEDDVADAAPVKPLANLGPAYEEGSIEGTEPVSSSSETSSGQDWQPAQDDSASEEESQTSSIKEQEQG